MIRILDEGCTCGHDHRTHRGEHVSMCLDCRCSEFTARCQCCGEEAVLPRITVGPRIAEYDVCSRRCALQLQHAAATLKARAGA